ncbi:TIGR03790 family protein [Haloferula chungangensis]|uniref:TIGR03790 family protein n=1 Tax=Haloferula chungangensis TaxID=1048331 RepID=A0ABW2L9K8_9BACT
MLRALLFLLIAPLAFAAPRDPIVQSVAVLYNTVIPGSEGLAKTYAIARGIPEENLVGLKLPDKEEVTRSEYDTLIRKPLAAEFDRRQWWQRSTNDQGMLQMNRTRIQIIVCMRGIPSRVLETSPPPPAGAPPVPETQKWMENASACVDSELSLLGIEGYPTKGQMNNPYFKKDTAFSEAGLPIFLVGRIDGPSFPTCVRMIKDAVAAEKTGLWGMAVIDIANKGRNNAGLKMGDTWLEATATSFIEQGIPTLVDRFDPTLPTNYPLNDTALYFGWYDWNVSGPFKNPAFKFKRGAVAVHLHSFSAAQLRNVSKNWCAPLLDRGAAATLGNVYEPLLHLTHDFDTFTRRLLAGYTLVEAAYMSAPALSWHNVVLGDPLYRPFLHLDGSGEKEDADAEYRALRIAQMRWPRDPAEREKQLRLAAQRMKSGVMLEALGLSYAENIQSAQAAVHFQEAKTLYNSNVDKFRMDMLIAALDRKGSRKAAAVKTLRDAQLRYAHLPEITAAAEWLNIIDPPAPPPATPKK